MFWLQAEKVVAQKEKIILAENTSMWGLFLWVSTKFVSAFVFFIIRSWLMTIIATKQTAGTRSVLHPRRPSQGTPTSRPSLRLISRSPKFLLQQGLTMFMKYLFIITEWRKGSKQLSTIIYYILFSFNASTIQPCRYNKYICRAATTSLWTRWRTTRWWSYLNLISPYHIIPGSGAGSHDWPWLHPVSHHPLLILPLQGQLRILSHLALILTQVSNQFPHHFLFRAVVAVVVFCIFFRVCWLELAGRW